MLGALSASGSRHGSDDSENDWMLSLDFPLGRVCGKVLAQTDKRDFDVTHSPHVSSSSRDESIEKAVTPLARKEAGTYYVISDSYTMLVHETHD